MARLSNSHLFEISWEVCNKVGSIHTVIRDKAAHAVKQFGDNYHLIGPWLARNPKFEETDEPCWRHVREPLAVRGIACRLGRWNVAGRPKAILVKADDQRDPEQLLYQLWESFGVDSIAGGRDYVEPLLFGTACGEVVAAIANQLLSANGAKVIAHFHEWVTGSGLLHVKAKAPQVATVFTAHATVAGRTVMEAGHELYASLSEISPMEEARKHNIVAKHSLESVSARESDCFTAVSEITAREAGRLLGRRPSLVTLNGMDIEALPDFSEDRGPALESRQRLLDHAARFLGTPTPDDARLVMSSGRYEFSDKGLDVFLDALAQTRDRLRAGHHVISYLFIIAPHMDRRPERGAEAGASLPSPICTHRLRDENSDPILRRCRQAGLTNQADSPVKVIFVPVYLSKGDGVLNMPYYDVLRGFDLGVFPSRYEPWGYTPLESAGSAVPTVTTDQAGFGIWAKQQTEAEDLRGVLVTPRVGKSPEEVAASLSALLLEWVDWSADDLLVHRRTARQLAQRTSWNAFYGQYLDAYERALLSADKRAFREEAIRTGLGRVVKATESVQPHFRSFVVETEVPAALGRLRELAHSLWWAWHPTAMQLFARLDPHLWEGTGHNPVRLLDEVSPDRLEELAASPTYVRAYEEVVSALDAYMADERPSCAELAVTPAIGWNHPVAYFSTEFGLHESLPIYSGGLGVLSGDHLKSASDMNVPLVGVGLFYSHGYFRQSIDTQGRQVAEYPESHPSALPMKQVQDEAGTPVAVAVDLPGRTLYASVWRLRVGRVNLYLLDTDLPANTSQDREITSRLYVADERVRLEQEILLGIGGPRMLHRLGVCPSIYHLNEGHSAFLILEQIRRAVQDMGLTFDEARELVRAQVVFTTHTPVEAGNQLFSRDLMQPYFAHYMMEVGITPEQFFGLGQLGGDEGLAFGMTILALKGAYLANAVSGLHGRVARRMWERAWNGVHRSMVPITAITNGVHIATFLGAEMRALLDTYLGIDWDRDDVMSAERWSRLHEIPEELLWEAKYEMKQRLIAFVKEQLAVTWDATAADGGLSIEEIVSRTRSSSLTVGFARRFAPYKRATLLFTDLERLDRIVNNPRRPVQFVFAGKAHPKDAEGCRLVAEVVRITRDSRFAGRVVFLENYDLVTAKLLVQGVDIWLNTPRRPYEASGTSGQKACLNGGINLSVADGWWCEGATGGNGWTIGLAPKDVDENSESNDFQDANHLYSLLEDSVVPLFYQRSSRGIPEGWLSVMRRSMETIAPVFNTHRMIVDYYNRLYAPCAERAASMGAGNGRKARDLAAWKRGVAGRFSSVHVLDITTSGLTGGTIPIGSPFTMQVRLDPGEVAPDEICVELVVGKGQAEESVREPTRVRLRPDEGSGDRVATYRGEFVASDKGSYSYGIRIMPFHPDLGDLSEMGLVVWA